MTNFNWLLDDDPESMAGKLRAMERARYAASIPPKPRQRNDVAGLLRHAGDLIEGFSSAPHTHFGMIAAALNRAAHNLEDLFTTPEAVAALQAACGLSDDDIERLIFVGSRG